MQYRSAIDPSGVLFREASQTKNVPNVLCFVPEVPFLCVNSVICLKSAIISSFYISHLSKIVFFIGFYDNICLIIPKTKDGRGKF